MTPDIDRRSIFLAAFTMLSWGMAGIFVRLLLPSFVGANIPIPFAVLGGRLFLSFVALIIGIALFTPRALGDSILPSLRRGETWFCALFQFLYYLLAVIAFTLSPIGEIALCASTAPLWVLLIRRVRGQAISRKEWMGAVIALIGVAVIVLPNLLKHSVGGKAGEMPYRAVGDALSLTSAAITAVYALVLRRYTRRDIAVDPRALSLATFAIGSPLVLFLVPLPAPLVVGPTPLALFLGLAVLSTVLPTLAFASASRYLPPVTTATLALLLPIFATTYAAIFLKEMPPWTLFPGGALVLLGLWNILRPDRGNER